MDNPMDGEQVDTLVQMATYMPFDIREGQGGLA